MKKQINMYDDHPDAVPTQISIMKKQGWKFIKKVHKYSGLWKMKYYKLYFEKLKEQ